jgi:hypothetical protein
VNWVNDGILSSLRAPQPTVSGWITSRSIRPAAYKLRGAADDALVVAVLRLSVATV